MKSWQRFLAFLCAFLLTLSPGVQPASAEPRAQAERSPAPLAQIEHKWHSPLTRRFTPAQIEPVNLANSNRLEALMRAGRIYLSLHDAIALALENNLDIEIQRYTPRIAQADLLRAQAGGLLRGIPTSVTQGPSSAINLQTGGAGGAAGVTTGAGGGQALSGAGSGTIITSTGTTIPNLDEQIFLTYNWGHRTVPLANSLTTGIPALQFDNNDVNFGIRRGFLTGTQMDLFYTSSAQTSNNRVSEINPVTNANLSLQITQPLLRGFGLAVNSRNIRIAKNNLKVADLVFKQQVIATVATVVNLYADLVRLNEDVKVRRQALALNEKLYNDNKKQVEIGTLAPIEIIRAEAEVARTQQELTQAETQLLQQETIIKNYLSRTGVFSPALSDARIVPTDPLRMPDVEEVQPIQDLVAMAIENRPELAETDINIENARINLAGSRSQMLPQLDLVLSAQNNGLAGQPNSIPLPGGVPFQRQANPAFIGGIGTVLSQIFARNYPNYAVGFQLSVPIRNRAAQADMIRDQLTLRQSELRQRREINQIRVDVQNALIGLQQARAQYQAAQKSRILQEQNLEAEQKKYALGASTIFFVIQAQRDLAAAQAAEVAALSAYNRSKVALDTATGLILKTYNISLDEALQGRVSRPPSPLPQLDPNGR